jgi:hypothetical protein
MGRATTLLADASITLRRDKRRALERAVLVAFPELESLQATE